jgi:hypothetical protein
VTLTVGLVWLITAWSFGIKAFDAFLLTVAAVVVAAGAHMAKPFIDQALGRNTEPADEFGPPPAPG